MKLDGIREYIYSLMVVAFTAGAIESFAPSGEKNGLSRCVKFVTGLLVALVLLRPVYPLLGFVSGLFERETSAAATDINNKEDVRSEIAQKSADIISERLREGVSRKTGIDSDDVEIRLTLDTSDYSAVKIDKADAVIPKERMYECEKVRLYIESEIECPVEVRAEDGGD